MALATTGTGVKRVMVDFVRMLLLLDANRLRRGYPLVLTICFPAELLLRNAKSELL